MSVESNLLNYVNSFFSEIKYSNKIFSAKEEIYEKLLAEYNELLKDHSKVESFEIIVKKYHNLDRLAEAIWYTKEDIKERESDKETITHGDFNEKFNKQKWRVYLVTLFSILAVSCVINAILYVSPYYLIGLVLWWALALFFNWKLKWPDEKKESFSVDNAEYFRDTYDLFTKRTINWIFITTTFLFLVLSKIIEVAVNSSKFSEVSEQYVTNAFLMWVVIFFLCKDYLILKWFTKKIELEKGKIIWKELWRVTLFTVLYWVVAIWIFLLYKNFFVSNPMLSLLLIFVACAIIYDLTRRKKFTYKNFTVNRVVVIAVVLWVIGVWIYSYLSKDVYLIQPYINRVPNVSERHSKIEYNDDNGVYTITMDNDDFKILQLTDIHLWGSSISFDKDLLALNAVYKLIAHTRPDLVFVTWDLTFPLWIASFSLNNSAPVIQFASFMRNLWIPWAFTYWNHDTESMAIMWKTELNEVYKSLSYKASKNLLYPYVQPEIMWRNNQLIELRNSDWTLNQALFLIDSNAYTWRWFSSYDYIHDDEVDRYKDQVLRLNEEENKTVSSLVFFHIPLQEYETAYNLYLEWSDDVKYYFWSNDEKWENKICASKYPSKMFSVAKELWSTRWFFCWHDHYNNMSLEYSWIRLTYWMSIDYLVMPWIYRDTKQRGATLITTHKDSSIDIEQIPLTTIEDEFEDNEWILQIYAKLNKIIDMIEEKSSDLNILKDK